MKLKKKRVTGPCPCHSGRDYRECCEPLHKGEAAESPERLMRSRYASFALGDANYLMATTHPEGAAFRADTQGWRKDLREYTRKTRFVGLEILDAHDDEVTFRAELMRGDRDATFVERSTFRQHEGRWKYLEGEVS
jgi:SEC-C motif-containing protein